MLTMVRTQEAKTPFEQAVQEQWRTQSSVLQPAWVASRRIGGWTRLEALGLPSRALEAWRYVNLEPVSRHGFVPLPEPASLDVLDPVISALTLPEAAAKLVFVNGIFQPTLSDTTRLPEGVLAGSLFDVAAQLPQPIESYFAADIEAEADAFVALNTALFSEGYAVYVPQGVKLDTPLEVLFLTDAQGTSPQGAHVRGVVIAEPHSQVTIMARFASAGAASATPTLTTAVTELVAQPGALLNYVHVQTEADTAAHMAATKTWVHGDARLHVSTLAFGSRFSRHYVHSAMVSEEACCELNGLAILQGETHVFDHTVIDHQKPHGGSQQLYKGILAQRSRADFDGTIVIAPHAQKSDASQLHQTLLLSDEARVLTRPQLRIDADDVKCAHGASVGQLSEDQLFYLTSRGLPFSQAQAVLTAGFADEIVEAIPCEALKAPLIDLVHSRLEALLTANA